MNNLILLKALLDMSICGINATNIELPQEIKDFTKTIEYTEFCKNDNGTFDYKIRIKKNG